MAESALLLSSASSLACQPLLSTFLLSFSSAQHVAFPVASLAPLADLCIRSGLSLSTVATALATDSPATSSKPPSPTPADASAASPSCHASAPWTLAVTVVPAPPTLLPRDGDSSGDYLGRRVSPLFTSPAYRSLDPSFQCTATADDASERPLPSLPNPAHLTQCLPPHIRSRGVAYGYVQTPLYSHPFIGKALVESPYYGSIMYRSYSLLPNPISHLTSVPAPIQDAVAPPPSKTDTWHVTVPSTFRSRSIGRKRVGGSGGSGSDGWDGGMDGAGFSGGDPWSFDGSDFPYGGSGDGFGGGWGNSGGGGGGGGGSWSGGGGGFSGGDPGAGGAGGEGGGGEDDPWWREWEQGGDGWRDADFWLWLQSDRFSVPRVARPTSVWSIAHMWAWQFSRDWAVRAWGVRRGASLLYRIACWISLSRCFCHALGTALAASASAPPALRRAAASVLVATPQAEPPALSEAAAEVAQKRRSSAVATAVEGAWRGSLAQSCYFSGSLVLALNAASARWGAEKGEGEVGEW
ncbi:hypothetical protein CLOM_g14105 [Closterium sp. NIES-68]|nr:hypothetical protein CLOM_g14105 [Closterium sp. NIES-68]GJP82044.1 hypothetical protein CLOP_g12169 [Closterium sp. NIES-67]